MGGCDGFELAIEMRLHGALPPASLPQFCWTPQMR